MSRLAVWPGLKITMFNEDLMHNLQPSSFYHAAQAVTQARDEDIPFTGHLQQHPEVSHVRIVPDTSV